MWIDSVIVDEPGKFKIQRVELKEPGIGEVLIKLKGSGICHTDTAVINQYVHTPLPIALGHEGSGIIEKIGPGVESFKEQDKVIITFSSCGQCSPCLNGLPAACDFSQELNFGTVMEETNSKIEKNGRKIANLFGQSSLSTYCIANVRNLVKIPFPEMDISILGPLACGIQAGAGAVLNVLRPGLGESIAIFGCGGVGLSAIMAAALTEAKNIIAVDVVPKRLELAKELGATHVIHSKNCNAVEEIKKITNGGAEYAIDLTGVPECVQQAIRCTRNLGKIVLIGGAGETEIHIYMDLIGKSRTIMGLIEGNSLPQEFIPRLLYYYKQGRFPLDKLIRKYQFNELEKAFEDMKKGKTVKPVIVF